METRMPSYDNDLMDFAFQLPLKLKYHQFLYRKVFSDLFPQLANIKREYYNLPISATNFRFAVRTFEKKILNKLKTTPLRSMINLFPGLNRPTYIHYNKWFKEDLKTQLMNVLTDKRTLSRGFYDTDGINRLYHAHITTKQDLSPVLWQLVNFEYFCRNFLD
jgi:asparagine synthase (glutamine-hydrolysing)